jgi:hypothetical protein
MPWGKHRGELLTDIDTSYLGWVADGATATRPWLRAAVRAELARRSAAPPQASTYPPPVDVRGILKRWHHEMVMRYHPDRGGDGNAMAAINHAHDRLRELLEAV